VTLKDYPSWSERDVHIWTNMVRVDPVEFFGPGSPWGANCDLDDFQASEKTPKRPLYHDVNLNDAGRFHSIDMWENSWFDHASSDGTSFPARLGRFYTESGMIGENIAMGYPDARAVVLYGWMCSAGHRSNIMNPDYNELGVGVVGTYYTQDFAAGVLETDGPIAMGNHSPEVPTSTVDFLVDYQGGEPDRLEVVLDGKASPVLLTFGAPDQGVYTTTVVVAPNASCHSYYFQWREGSASGTFPEDGSYLFGSGCTEDAMWENRQAGGDNRLAGEDNDELEAFDEGEDEIIGCGCSASVMGAGPATGMFGLLGVLLLMRRRP
jgi:uncharacterized protein (TIGR03382 family)